MEDRRISFGRRSVRVGLAAVTAALLIVGAARYGMAAKSSAPGGPDSVAQAQTPSVPRPVAGGRDSYADIVKVVAPAVVTIRTEARARVAPTGFQDDGLFRQFFGDQYGGQRVPPSVRPMPQVPRRSGLGSGVIVSADGYILTNHHVVDSADRIRVELTDGRTVDATLVGSDQPSDLALVKVEASDLRPLALGDSDAVAVGDVVLAVGNPLGLGQTVTMGIISAKGRSTDRNNYEEFLQTDAPINHGNSGGALVNMRGELIGINSQIASVSDGNIGIGFAIPTSMAKRVMEDLKAGGRVRRSQLGVSIQAVTSDIAASLGLKEVGGAIVSSVTPGSAADRAGVKTNDVIKSFNGQAVKDTNSIRNRAAESTPGSTATLVVIRDGSERSLTVKLDEKEPEKTAANRLPADREDPSALGVTVAPLTADLAQRFGVPAGVRGLLVQGVNPGSRAAEAGIQPGDVIQQVNRQDVLSVEDLRAAVRRSADRPTLVLVHRDGQTTFVTVRPS